VTTESVISSINKLQWRSSTNAYRSNQQRKAQKKEKANTKVRQATKEKVTEATVNINREATVHSQRKEKEKLDKECLGKDNMTMEKESHAASPQDKEKDRSFVTSVDYQATR